MKIEHVKVSELASDPHNTRVHDQRNIEAITFSLSRFGQQKPIVVDAKGVVLAGNGTLSAAKALGWSKIAITRTKLENEEAVAYSVADNRTAELGAWDWEGLGAVLRDLSDAEDINLEELGWAEHEIENILQADWEPHDPSKGDGTEFADTKGLIIKFTIEQFDKLNAVIEGDVTAESIIDKVML